MVDIAPLLARAKERHDLPPPEERRRRRVAAGLRLAEVAEPFGVSSLTVSRWERGLRTPRGDLLLAYGKFLRGLEAVA